MVVNKTRLGATGSSPNDLGNMGALRPILGQLADNEDRGQMAIDFAQQLYPAVEKADPYEAALQFFLAMGQGASKPGATVLGSAVGAMQAPADYLAAKKKEKKETDQARMQTALSLAPSLKPGAGKVTYRPATAEELKDYNATSGQMGSDGKFYDLSKTNRTASTSTVSVNPENLENLRTLLSLPNLTPDENNNVVLSNANIITASNQGLVGPKQAVPKQGVEKYLQQDRVLYLSDENAKAKLAALGVNEGDTEYADLFSLITTDDPNLIGRPVIQADSYINYYIPRAGEDSEFNVITRTPGGSPVPAEVIDRNEILKGLSKIAIKQNQVMNDLLPTLDSAMTVLLQNQDLTGAFQSYTMPIRSFMSSAFGFSDSELESQRYLEAISNKLAPQMRPVGSGATSDMEFRAYKSAILTMENPAVSNYLTLYSLDKTTRNAQKEIQLRRQLLTQNKSIEYIENKVLELDKGIYEKFDGIDAVDENGNAKYNTANEYIAARNAWKASLPNGAVILNKDSSGNKIYPNSGTFIIKGWGG
jgi:hypothetical protein